MSAFPHLTDTQGKAVPVRRESNTSDEEQAKDVNSPSFKEERYIGSISSTTDSESELHAKWYEPPEEWESKHRWDPSATWTPEEQAKLTRKLGQSIFFPWFFATSA